MVSLAIKGWCLIYGSGCLLVAMNSTTKNWNILSWNIRGMNSEPKWLALKQKIEESDCAILCLQETKREEIDAAYLFFPKQDQQVCFLALNWSFRWSFGSLEWFYI